MGLRALGWALVGLALVGTTGCPAPAPADTSPAPAPNRVNQSVVTSPTPSPVRFRVAVTQPNAVSAYLLPYWVGFEAGLFRQEGLALEMVTLQSEQLAVSAVTNGDMDLIVATPSPVMFAAAAAVGDMMVIGATHNRFDQRLIAVAEVTSIDELRGKSAIVNARGTLNDFQTREALRRVGLDPETDLAGYWSGPNQQERIQHLKLGNGQAIALAPPLSTILVKEGLVDLGDLSEGEPWPGVAIWTSKRRYVSRFPYMERFARAFAASIARTKSDPELARQTLARYTQITDPEALAETYAIYGDRLLERAPRLNRAGLQRALDFAAEARPGVPLPPASGLVDETLIEGLAANGLIDRLYR